MKFPLELSRKYLALSPQLYIHDANGDLVLYAFSNILNTRDHIEVFSDDTKENKLYDIKGDYEYDADEPRAHHFTNAKGKGHKRIEKNIKGNAN